MTVKAGTTLSAALLIIYAGLVAWTFHAQATAWPGAGNWGAIVFVFVVPGLVFQTVNLLFTWRTGRRMGRRWLVRLATIPLGLVLAMLLVAATSARARAGFEAAYAPFIARVEANLAAPCEPVAPYFALPAVAAFNRDVHQERPTVMLAHDRRRFVLSFAGASLDMDGSTIYYVSDERRWHQFHNDDHAAAAVHDKLVEGLQTCLLRPE